MLAEFGIKNSEAKPELPYVNITKVQLMQASLYIPFWGSNRVGAQHGQTIVVGWWYPAMAFTQNRSSTVEC